MKRRGWTADRTDAAILDNPLRFMSQNPRFELGRVSLAGCQFHGFSILSALGPEIWRTSLRLLVNEAMQAERSHVLQATTTK